MSESEHRWSKQVKPQPQPIEPLFEALSAEGYRMVEWRSPTRRGTTVPETDLLEDAERARGIKAVSEGLGITLTYHAPQGDLWQFGVLPFDTAVLQLRECILRSTSIGAQVMTLHLGVVLGEGRADAILKGARVIREALPFADDSGVTLCVENVFDESSVATVEDCEALFDAVDSDRVGFTLDTGHGHLCGCLHELAEAFGDRLLFTHLHDNPGVNGGTGDRHLVPGRGTIDWPRLIGRLDGAGYAGPLSFELREDATLPELASIWAAFSTSV